MKKFIMFFILTVISLSGPSQISYAYREIDVVFSDTFEGDLSLWSCSGIDANQCTDLVIEEKKPYINQYVTIAKENVANTNHPTLKSIPFKVEEETIYTVAVDMKGYGCQNAYIVFLDEYGSRMTALTNDFSVNLGKKWGCAFISVESPEGAVQGQVYLVCEATDDSIKEASFDNVVVCKGIVGVNQEIKKREQFGPLAKDSSVTVLESERVVYYENFEDGITGWDLSLNKGKSDVKVTSLFSHTGTRSMKLEAKEFINDAKIISEKFYVTSLGEYNVSFSLYNQSGETATVNLIFYDEKGKELHIDNLVVKKAVAPSWVRYEYNLTSPQNAHYAKFVIGLSKSAGCNYIDNLKVKGDKPNNFSFSMFKAFSEKSIGHFQKFLEDILKVKK